jgi:hypothetical protein
LSNEVKVENEKLLEAFWFFLQLFLLVSPQLKLSFISFNFSCSFSITSLHFPPLSCPPNLPIYKKLHSKPSLPPSQPKARRQSLSQQKTSLSFTSRLKIAVQCDDSFFRVCSSSESRFVIAQEKQTIIQGGLHRIVIQVRL